MKKIFKLLVLAVVFIMSTSDISFAKENYKVLDKKTLEKIGGHVENHTFVDVKTFNNITFEVRLDADIYINGSFREILKVNSKNVKLIKSGDIMIESYNIDPFIHSLVELLYITNLTLVRFLNETQDDSFLIDKGFKKPKEKNKNSKRRYTLPLDFRGGFSLY